MTTYFENIIVELHVFYVLKMNVKFHVNCMLFTFNPEIYFLCIILDYKNSKFKNLIDDIGINF